MKRGILVLLLFTVLSYGCVSTINETRAGAIAHTFASRQVKPIARENATAEITDVNLAVVSTERGGPGYIVTLNMSGIIDGEEKSTLLIVGVDGRGQVRSFNGQNVVPIS